MRLGCLTRVGNRLLRESLDLSRLVALGVDEPVVQNLDGSVLGREEGDLVCDGLGIGKGWDVLADTGEVENDVLGVRSAELGLALLADDDEFELRLGLEESSGRSRQAGVDTTTETFIGAADDEQLLLALGLQRLGLRLFEDGVRGLAVSAGIGHRSLGAGELGRSHNLHRLGDLFDVLNRLQAALDFTKGRISRGILRNDDRGPILMNN